MLALWVNFTCCCRWTCWFIKAWRYGCCCWSGVAEAAGQATEGTTLEPVARVVGAFAAPMTASKIANKTIKRSIERPSVESLRDAKNVAYDAVDKSGVKFSTDEVGNLINRAKASVDEFNMFQM